VARRIIESPPTGETFIFDDDWNAPDGRVRQLEYVLKSKCAVPPHFHPDTAQSFEVISGTLHIRVNGQTRVLGPGETTRTGVGDIHAQWNEGPDPVRVVEAYDPPLDIEPFFTGLAHAIGSRNPLKIAVFFADFSAVSRPGNAPLKLLTTVMAPLGRLVGLGGWHRRPQSSTKGPG
jgi:quercetin dioxygenase-like cupin family protein